MTLEITLVGRLQVLKRIFTVDYQYQSFMISIGMSVVGLLWGAALEWAFRKITKRPYNVANPFTPRDVMPVEGKDGGFVPVAKGDAETESSEGDEDARKF